MNMAWLVSQVKLEPWSMATVIHKGIKLCPHFFYMIRRLTPNAIEAV